jgi:hypothetical protein
VEAADCVKPPLKSVQKTRIRSRRKYRAIGFRIQMGSKTSYACGSRKVKKLKGNGVYKARILGTSDE